MQSNRNKTPSDEEMCVILWLCDGPTLARRYTSRPFSFLSPWSPMYPLLRRAEILRIAQSQGTTSIAQLAEALAVSDETIRRTVKPLIEEGLLIKVHGGVMLPSHLEESPFRRRMHEHRAEKEIVARQICELVQDGDSLILDSGTTCTHIAQALRSRSRLTVITNSAAIASLLAQHNGNRVFMAGGELCADDAAALGEPVLAYIRQFHVKYAIVSVTAVDGAGRFMDAQPWDVEFTRAAFGQARRRVVVAVHAKFEHSALVRAMNADEIDVLVTDAPLDAHYAQIFAAARVEVHYPGSAAAPMTVALAEGTEGPGEAAHRSPPRGLSDATCHASSDASADDAHGEPHHAR
ncbi:DeoR/GlpR family DNA-binding transcription regulator [Paraburkholderia atlantica]|uniref:DeoR/GlpR family DNA-binding transcription regulator n=1 Tax=Paraburkholderia atlantica TaxID=2654982 RepID=UPI0017BC1CE1|nr:DeoR/GlpR family DNA-binding transcription regulator [Paraburkholderia atlantica]MBB5414162.1 DeoR family glycerol-3-phosphate regulon repressor [Paraburkholderia atlantica]